MWSNSRSERENLQELRRGEQLCLPVLDSDVRGVHSLLDRLRLPVSGETLWISLGDWWA